MAKRFTDTNKYKKPFLRGLQGAYKLLWDFLYHECDHAGVWIVDFAIAQIYVGADMPINYNDAINFFNAGETRIVEFEAGKKWFIPSFIEFQYGNLNPKNRAHSSVISILLKYNLLGQEKKISPLQGATEGCKDKDMVKDKDKDKEIVLEVNKNNINGPPFFEIMDTGNPVEIDRSKFFIPRLMEVWEVAVPGYPADEEKDYPALHQISAFLRKQEKIPHDPAVSQEAAEQIKIIWQALAQHVAKHSFFRTYSLDQVSRHMQNIIQDFKHGKGSKPDINGKSIDNKLDSLYS